MNKILLELVPRPQVYTQKDRIFFLPYTGVRIMYAKEFLSAARFLQSYLAELVGVKVQCTEITQEAEPCVDVLYLLKSSDYGCASKPESYAIESENGILVKAESEAGAFYAVQSLRQIFITESVKAERNSKNPQGVPLPNFHIEDYPQYEWRGIMLDTSRHFYSAAFVKKIIDAAALHKLNRFHWHFTDDQGWRFPVKKYPDLTEKGGWRRDVRYPPDNKTGGFYTEEEIRDVVEYAKERNIIVVPEIEIPGHASAFLTALPELGCSGGPYHVRSEFGVFNEVMCGGNDKLFEVLEDIFDAVVELFPGDYIHIGGDECPREAWKTCPKCQARIKNENLGDENGLQGWITGKAAKMVEARGKIPIGWDEVLEAGSQALPKNLVIQSWRGMSGGIKAGQEGFKVIMSPTEHCYLDYRNTDSCEEPGNIGILPLERVYSFYPVPESLPKEYHSAVLGGQGNLWTEVIYASKIAEYMLFPRLCALAEVLWLEPQKKDYKDFVGRLKTHKDRLQNLSLLYCDSAL
ncbi:beta-N-acetylhexosaminidase [Treponema phagedenis]|uniref:beta-N-acetylhexosaminidase n=1 Tax=Treponema phagedenis TaxID=162 RepID=UPI0001F63FC8|nr:beta-N-acetylhexosaminidase [Treponema phagedenis]EFW37129.1 glycosyl hydrolase family 20, catalytic domain protein [Treponema phagedenis F0421]TYT79634.1 beta-N-acetylhexosaminidase [Treponema phagedenis]